MSVHPKTPALRLRLSPAAESIVRGGHPWVFAESVRRQNRPGKTGELAVIYDRHDEFLAAGLFDPDSPIRVRILHRGKPQPLHRAWWRQHLDQALARRAGLFDEQTTGYRCINGENDGWPGLVLDRYHTTLALKLYTAAWLPRLRGGRGTSGGRGKSHRSAPEQKHRRCGPGAIRARRRAEAPRRAAGRAGCFSGKRTAL